MAECGIPKKLISLVKICLEGSKSRVKIDGTHSDCFEVRSGLKQGDALSPVLFNIALESVFRNLEHRQQIFSRTGISLILTYAADIDVVGDSFDTVRGIFLQFQQEAKKMGLNINEDKTKYLQLSRIRR